MYLNRRFHASKGQELADFISGGRLIAQGNNLTTTSADETITVPAAADGRDDFSKAQSGDRIHISGESSATVFTVASKTNDQELEMSDPATANRGGDGHWKILRGGVDPTKIHTIIEDPNGGGWTVIFESDTFFVPDP